jgi:hypothetical protein
MSVLTRQQNSKAPEKLETAVDLEKRFKTCIAWIVKRQQAFRQMDMSRSQRGHHTRDVQNVHCNLVYPQSKLIIPRALIL